MIEPGRVRLICLKKKSRVHRLATPAELVLAYQQWAIQVPRPAVTASLLTGQYYTLYKRKFHLFPISHVREDMRNMELLLTNYVSEDPTLAPYIVEYFFTVKGFNNISTQSFTNEKILGGWHAIEQAQKLRTGRRHGEQAEFVPPAVHTYGSIRI